MDIKSLDISLFKHKIEGEVRFSEVDSFQVVHNLAYLYWIEWARTQYLFNVADTRDSDYFTREMPLMTVHHTIDYHSSLRFADKYSVRTRTARLGDSSIRLESIVLGPETKPVVSSETVMVYVDAANSDGRPIPFPEEYRQRIAKYEGISV